MVEISILDKINFKEDVDVFIIPLYLNSNIISEEMDSPLEDDFNGKEGKIFWSYSKNKKRIVWLGLGEENSATIIKTRNAIGDVAGQIRKKGLTSVAIINILDSSNISVVSFVEIAVEGLLLGNYKFDKLLSNEKQKKAPLEKILLEIEGNKEAAQSAIKYGKIIAEATNFTRDLCNSPHNIMNSIIMAKEITNMANKYDLKVSVLDKDEIAEKDMNLFLAVNQGSKIPPKLVILDYNPGDARKSIVLVGKGIMFDTGGISLKPVAQMGNMIYDMCGAGAVVGVLESISRLKPQGIRVVGITPLTDNCPDGNAYKPGDIIKSKSGKTVEIISTDAEGRLILADALTLAKDYNPDLVIDMATLTGASVVALGGIYAAAFYNEAIIENIKKMLINSAEYTGDLIWEMPMHKDYFNSIKTPHADIKNSGGRYGGVSSSAMFLAQFTDGYPWIHLDIAGTAQKGMGILKPGGINPHGASGFGVRLLVDFIIQQWKDN